MKKVQMPKWKIKCLAMFYSTAPSPIEEGKEVG